MRRVRFSTSRVPTTLASESGFDFWREPQRRASLVRALLDMPPALERCRPRLGEDRASERQTPSYRGVAEHALPDEQPAEGRPDTTSAVVSQARIGSPLAPATASLAARPALTTRSSCRMRGSCLRAFRLAPSPFCSPILRAPRACSKSSARTTATCWIVMPLSSPGTRRTRRGRDQHGRRRVLRGLSLGDRGRRGGGSSTARACRGALARRPSVRGADGPAYRRGSPGR